MAFQNPSGVCVGVGMVPMGGPTQGWDSAFLIECYVLLRKKCFKQGRKVQLCQAVESSVLMSHFTAI